MRLGEALRLARRSLGRHPGHTAILLLSFTLGLAAWTAARAVLHERASDAFASTRDAYLVSLPREGDAPAEPKIIEAPSYRDRVLLESPLPSRKTDLFSALAAGSPDGGPLVPVQVVFCTRDLFGMLGFPVRSGAIWPPAADAGRERPVVLSEAAERTLFAGARRGGRTLRLFGEPFQSSGTFSTRREGRNSGQNRRFAQPGGLEHDQPFGQVKQMKDATPNAAIRRTLGYPRVSTREQEIAGVSLDAQAEKIGNYCRLHSLPAPILFPEVESGGEENEANRKKVAALLADVRRGDMVIVTDIDRFGRDVVFIVKNVRQIMRKGAVFVAIDKGFDSRSPMAEDTLANWAVGAEQERRRIKERTEGGRKHLRLQGYFVEGQPPFGYERLPKPKGTKTPLPLRVVPEHAAVVRRMFALCLEGYSVFATAKRLRQEYGSIKAFGRAWVVTALRNRTYTGRVAKTSVRPSATRGVVQLPAEWIPAHEAIIDDETFNNAQLALRGRRRGRKPQDASATANYLLRGFCRCAECGGSVAARPVDRSGRHKVGYYVCRGHVEQKEKGVRCKLAAWLRQPDADAAASEQFLTFARSLLTSLTRPPRQIEKPDFAAQRREIKISRQRVVEFVAKGLFTVDDVKVELNRLDDALAAIEAKEAEFKETAVNDTVETRKHAHAYVQQVVDEWSVLPVDVRRALIRAFSSKVEATKDKQIRTTWRDPSQISAAHGAQELPALRPAPNVAALPAPSPIASPSPIVAALPAPTMSARDYLGSPERAPASVERSRG